MNKGKSIQQMVLGKLEIHIQTKNKIRLPKVSVESTSNAHTQPSLNPQHLSGS